MHFPHFSNSFGWRRGTFALKYLRLWMAKNHHHLAKLLSAILVFHFKKKLRKRRDVNLKLFFSCKLEAKL